MGVTAMALAAIVHAPGGSIWPRWIVIASFVGTGAYFLYYALTGRSNFLRALSRRRL